MRLIEWLLMGIALLALSGCDDATPDYRYRLTVEVETPEGLRSGSGVIEVEQDLGRPGMNPAGSQIYRSVRGEAVAVDLPNGRTLFALLRSESDIEWAETIVAYVAPPVEKSEDEEPRFDHMLALEGAVEIPRTFPAYAWIEERSAYPMLVTFGDIDEPTSVEQVNPDDLTAAFGEGYALERITVEITDDWVTTGIEGRLGWWSRIEDSGGGLIPMVRNDSGRWEAAPGFDEGLVDLGLSSFSTEAFE
ncbi:MAG: hypothetical protein WA936_05395 [Erythrobacter sp.]